MLKPLARLLFAAGFALFTGCSSEAPDTPPEPPTESQASALQGQVALFRASWPVRSRADVRLRVRALSIAMMGVAPADADIDQALAPIDQQKNVSARLTTSLGEITLRYKTRFDDLRIARPDVDNDRVTPGDVGEAAAQNTFVAAANSLQSQGILNLAAYDVQNADRSQTRSGEGAISPNNAALSNFVESYDFNALRVIRGIRFANAGLRVRVHRTGLISSIRFGGAEIASQWVNGVEVPTQDGYYANVTQSDAVLGQRYAQDFPRVETYSTRTMYVMPTNLTTTIIEPRFVKAHAGYNDIGNVRSLGRRQFACYSYVRNEPALME